MTGNLFHVIAWDYDSNSWYSLYSSKDVQACKKWDEENQGGEGIVPTARLRTLTTHKPTH